MPRLFVAIDLPPPLKLSLSKLCADVSAACWVLPGNFHLTLCFIAEVDDLLAAEMASALGRISATRFELKLAALATLAVTHCGSGSSTTRRRSTCRRQSSANCSGSAFPPTLDLSPRMSSSPVCGGAAACERF